MSSTTLGIGRAFFFPVGGDLPVDLPRGEPACPVPLRLLANQFEHRWFWRKGLNVVLHANQHARRFTEFADNKAGFLPIGFPDELGRVVRMPLSLK